MANDAHNHESVSVITMISSGLLLLVILNSLRMKYLPKNSVTLKTDNNTTINVTGMTCSHCTESVKNTLLKLNGINSVEVDLDSGQVNIDGDKIFWEKDFLMNDLKM